MVDDMTYFEVGNESSKLSKFATTIMSYLEKYQSVIQGKSKCRY